jgi:acetylornithine/N-succinyldiaminopimelate aminotransferase
MTSAEIIAESDAHEVGLYARLPLTLARGRGVEVWDADGKRYLDFFAGVAVNNLGHCHPAVVDAVQTQASRLMHVSNHYYNPPLAGLTTLLCRHSFAERVFVCNSGAEANEAAMKLARRWGADRGGGRYEFLSTHGSFHGRTFATVTATGQEKYHRGFMPLLPGVRLVPFGDLATMAAAVHDETVAIMVEPIQGEGGVNTPGPEYLPGLRELATNRNLLLILDEIQTGCGRTGRTFAYEHAGVTPDIMTLAKALGGGLPIGAMCTTDAIASVFTPGSHGTTFGGNPVACAAAVAALTELTRPELLAHVREVGAHLRSGLETIARRRTAIQQVRGQGLLLGAELDRPGAPAVARCLADGLIINCTAERVLRLTPPLIVTRAQIDEALPILDRALAA